MRGKVVRGGQMLFREDLPISKPAIVSPLGLPPTPLVSEPFTILYRGRRLVLQRSRGSSHARVWGTEFALVEGETPRQIEEAHLAARAADVSAACDAWLGRVLPGVDRTTCLQQYGPQLAHVLKDEIEKACTVPGRALLPPVGQSTLPALKEGACLDQVAGYERVLVLDGKLYDLLTLTEYIGKFEKGIEPQFFGELTQLAATAAPEEVAVRMSAFRDRIAPNTYDVLKGRLFHDDRTFGLFLDGVHFVPEYVGKAKALTVAHDLAVEREVKLGALDSLRK